MARLTNKVNGMILIAGLPADGYPNPIKRALNKLAEYEDNFGDDLDNSSKKKQSFNSPVLIGQTIYRISGTARIKIVEGIIQSITFYQDKDLIKFRIKLGTTIFEDSDNIGQTWFLTREEAERMLKARTKNIISEII